MKSILIAVFAVVSAASFASAKDIPADFDGIASSRASLAEKLSQADPVLPAQADDSAVAGPMLTLSVERNATSKKAFAADGTQAEASSVKFLITVKAQSSNSEWAIGANDKLYSLGAARPAPEFSAVNKLAVAMELTGKGVAKGRGNKCVTETSYECVNGQTNECKVDKCGWCGKWEDGTWGCEWTTISAPYSCRPNGFRC